MKFASLASGSSGNSFILENKDKIILFDAGISCKQTFERITELNLNPKKISDIFITHEHTDHIRGLDVLKKKTNANIFMTKKTFLNSKIKTEKEKINFIKNNDSIKINNLEIKSFRKNHDAADPVSFTTYGNKTLSILTDIGAACNNVIDSVKDADSIILESNHDPYMLANCRYPEILKRRISSDDGHLSNLQASLLTLEHAKPKLNNLILGHLSLHSNTEKVAYNHMFSTIKHKKYFSPKLVVSNRFRPTNLFRV